MAMQIRPDYVNPLTMVADKKTAQKPGQPVSQQGGPAGKVAELQTKQQQLQNQILLLKAAGTDSAGATTETQKILEAELEKVAAELRSAKGSGTQTAAVRRNMDFYESEKMKPAPQGIYRIK